MNTGNNALYIARRADARLLLLSGHRVEGRAQAPGRRDRAASTRRGRGGRRTARCACATTRASGTCATSSSTPRRSRSRCSSRCCRGGARSTVAASFLFPRRGLAHVNAIDSYTRYPFGFFLKKRRLRVSSDVVVYPRILAEDAARERFRAVIGRAERRRPARRGHRDPLLPRVRARRFAAPRALEKVRQPRALDHEADRGRGRALGARRRRSVQAARRRRDDEFEEMISAAATLIYHAVRDGLDVTLSLPRVTLRAREAETGRTALPRAGAARAGARAGASARWSATRALLRGRRPCMTPRAREIETLLLAMFAAVPLYFTTPSAKRRCSSSTSAMAAIVVRVAIGKRPELIPARFMRWLAIAYVPFYFVDWRLRLATAPSPRRRIWCSSSPSISRSSRCSATIRRSACSPRR